ncbi:universal stress protein [bacterium]|jgi:nucleotide-binding universal stress UspA family protein|nr:universal stress protein [bacterium]
MYRYKNILVSLGWDEHDSGLASYAKLLSTLSDVDSVHFIHVLYPNHEPFTGISKGHQEIMEEARKHDFLEKMEEAVIPQFEDTPQTEIICELVQEGSPLPQMLRYVKENDIDLVIVGQNPDSHKTSRLCLKLVQKSPCSVLVIPWGTEAKIDHVLVPVDFSRFSKNALEIGSNICKALGLKRITALHVFGVSMVDETNEDAKQEAIRNMKLISCEEFSTFFQGLEFGDVEVEELDHLDPNVGRGIKFIAKEWNSDLLVVGSRGRTAVASILAGSITEYLIMYSHIPVLAVKEKGEGMGLIDALFGFDSKD